MSICEVISSRNTPCQMSNFIKMQFVKKLFINLFIIYNIEGNNMNKMSKKDKIDLKFDTSSANIGCFIRGKSKQKPGQHDRYSSGLKSKRKSRYERQKQLEFHDKAFLESVVCKILNDADCQGITELIDDMVFPRSNPSEVQNHKDNTCEQSEQQQITQIFSNYKPLSQSHHPPKIHIYSHTHQPYTFAPSAQYKIDQYMMANGYGKQQCNSTIQSSMVGSVLNSPKSIEQANPEVIHAMNSMLAYGYNYYPQGNYLYQRQFSQRKRKNGSGDQVNEYKIIPEKIQSDGRTTLMIRHIPNKYSQEMLFQEIGKNHKMKINFVYLPIDNYNSCNVGYAFVNFIHTKFINDFYKEYNGRGWDRFNSEKICELAYARIQGATNLMDHFQNSGGNQRGRTLTTCEEKKVKQSAQTDTSSPSKMITKVLDFQKVEDH